MLRGFQIKAQEALDHLFISRLLTFKLNAHKVTDEGGKTYRVHFYDSRIHSVVINVDKRASIASQVTEAVLAWLEIDRREFLRQRPVRTETTVLANLPKRITCSQVF